MKNIFPVQLNGGINLVQRLVICGASGWCGQYIDAQRKPRQLIIYSFDLSATHERYYQSKRLWFVYLGKIQITCKIWYFCMTFNINCLHIELTQFVIKTTFKTFFIYRLSADKLDILNNKLQSHFINIKRILMY